MRICTFAAALRKSTLCSLLLASLFQVSCNFKDEKNQDEETGDTTDPGTGTDPGTPTTKISFAEVESQIFKPSCLVCHSATTALGGVTLDTYAKVKDQLAKVKKTTLDDKTMPQGGSLSASKLQLLKTWIEQGAVETP